MAIFNRRTRRGVFEISSDNGLITIYALRRARGKGGEADPKLEALLAHNAQRLKEQQEMAKLESSANSKLSSPVSSQKQNRPTRTPVASSTVRGKSRQKMKRTLPKRHVA